MKEQKENNERNVRKRVEEKWLKMSAQNVGGKQSNKYKSVQAQSSGESTKDLL